jgi:REP element-mobilizing transposase RayT
MDKFQNKYRISSSRLQNWNYGSPGFYFITICTKNREHYFGEIQNDEMLLNELGSFVTSEWMKTLDIRPDMNLELGEFVVMPNHFHGIMMIGENEFNKPEGGIVGRDAMHRVSTANPTTTKNKFGPQSKNLGSVVRGFKSSVTTHAKKLNLEFGWQERFHDHIIRNHEEFVRISKYILDNPRNWKDDKFFG